MFIKPFNHNIYCVKNGEKWTWIRGPGKSGWQISSSGRPKSIPPDDVTGSEAGPDMRRRREPEVRLTSRDIRRHRFEVDLKPASSTNAAKMRLNFHGAPQKKRPPNLNRIKYRPTDVFITLCILYAQNWRNFRHPNVMHDLDLDLDSTRIQVDALGHSPTPFLSVKSCHLCFFPGSVIFRRSFLLTVPISIIS